MGEKLKAALGDSPYVADIRGVGMLWGVELVSDRSTLAPFPGSQKVTERIWDYLFKDGVILYKSLALAGAERRRVRYSAAVCDRRRGDRHNGFGP